MKKPAVGVVVDYVTEERWETSEIVKELNARGVENKLINIYTMPLHVEEETHGVNIAIARMESATHYRIEALKRMEIAGVKVVNSYDSIRLGGDKFVSLSMLHHVGIKIPETYMVASFESAIKAVSRVRTPAVLKPVLGTYGRGVLRMMDLEREIGLLDDIAYPYIIQKYIPHEKGDFRVYVIKNKAVGVIQRIPPKGEWKTNISVGAKAKKTRLSKKVRETAVKATKAIGAEYSGIDLMRAGKEYVVIDVNTQPDFKGFYRATGVNLARNIVDLVLE